MPAFACSAACPPRAARGASCWATQRATLPAGWRPRAAPAAEASITWAGGAHLLIAGDRSGLASVLSTNARRSPNTDGRRPCGWLIDGRNSTLGYAIRLEHSRAEGSGIRRKRNRRAVASALCRKRSRWSLGRGRSHRRPNDRPTRLACQSEQTPPCASLSRFSYRASLLAWLQSAQRIWRFSALVVPPRAIGKMWSNWMFSVAPH